MRLPRWQESFFGSNHLDLAMYSCGYTSAIHYSVNSIKKDNDQYVTYWMNNLQKLDTNENIFVTLGIFNILNSNKIFRAKKYDHIVYKKRTIIGQEKIENLQGKNRLFYAGAYLGYGFHEDGVKSGMRVAQMINDLKG